VGGPDHPLAKVHPGPGQLREQTWLLGPSAVDESGVVPAVLKRLGVPEDRQQIFQSHAAALEEAKRNTGVALAVTFAVSGDLSSGRLVKVSGNHLHGEGTWSTFILPEHTALPAAAELTRFISTPRATQAMLRGPGVTVGRFRPSIHVTLWS
jgi:DNA-binding transcriptional LysR family regulator